MRPCLSSEAQDAAKVFKYSKELRAQKIALLPPDVNESNSGFTPLSGAIRYGLTAIKGLGQSIVKAICEARESGGPFRSFFDFAERVESSTLNKRVFESLVSAGAFDSLKDGRPIEAWRGGFFNSIDAALSRAQRAKREKLLGQNGLFGAMPEEIDFANEMSPKAKGWTSSEMLAAEKAALGFYITGHPLERYIEILQSVKAVKSSELPELEQWHSRHERRDYWRPADPHHEEGRQVCALASGGRGRRNEVRFVAGGLSQAFRTVAE